MQPPTEAHSIALGAFTGTVCEMSGYQSSRVEPRLLEGLNIEQQQAVTHRGSPLLVLAGPGSGKTRVLTHRIASLVHEGTHPSAILAVTFTNKAAAEMRHRLAALLRPEDVPSAVSTFHAFCVRSLSRYAEYLDLPKSFTVCDASDTERLMKSLLNDDNADPKLARNLLSKISYAKNTLVSVDELAADHSQYAALAAEYWPRYARRLRDMGSLDFDDLLVYMRELLSLSEPHQQLASRFSSVLVDEWQDTNMVQYDIIHRLAGPSALYHDVCVVGDAEQAIYGWRGSTPEVVDRFVNDFAPCEVVNLGKNYRSTPEIVAASSAVLAGSNAKHKVVLEPVNKTGAPVRLYNFDDDAAECASIVKEIAAKSGSRAVLVRTNAQTRVFERELLANRIAHQVVGTARFTDRTEVRDVIAYLRLLTNPADEMAFARAASTPRRKLGESALSAFFTAARDASLLPGEALATKEFIAGFSARARNPLERFAADMENIRAALLISVEDAVRAVLNAGVYSFHSSEQERIENLDQLVQSASEYDLRNKPDVSLRGVDLLAGFVNEMSLSSSTDGDESSPVWVITVHAAKGREFDHVWVPGLEQDVFPHLMAQDRGGLDEERRLFFVAVSRAKSSLVLSYRNRHFVHGEWRYTSRSSFLDLLDGICLFSDRSSGYQQPRSAYQASSKAGAYKGGTYRGSSYKGGSSAASRSSTRSPMTQPSARPAAPPTPAGPRLAKEMALPGTKVHHAVFGDGVVENCAGPMCAIRFGSKLRTLDLTFAPLTSTD